MAVDEKISIDLYGISAPNISNDANLSLGWKAVENLSTLEPYIPHTERPEIYFVPIVFAIIFLVGVLGNGSLVFFFIRYPHMRNVPNTYILSLAVGDLVVIVLSVPFVSVIYTARSWPFGETVCRLQEGIRDLSISVTVTTLTILSIERYVAIVHPVFSRGAASKRSALLSISLIWLFSTSIALPGAFLSTVRYFPTSDGSTVAVCTPFPAWMGDLYPKINVLTKMVIFYALPLVIISFFYCLMARHLLLATAALPGEATDQRYRLSQMTARRNVAKMVLAFVFIFAICFLPNHVFLMWFYFHPSAKEDFNYFWNAFRIVGFCLTFINSCINPVALYCISGTFRKYFNQHLFCDLCRSTSEDYSVFRVRFHSSGVRINSRSERFDMSVINGPVDKV